jgi:hypothetical protein
MGANGQLVEHVELTTREQAHRAACHQCCLSVHLVEIGLPHLQEPQADLEHALVMLEPMECAVGYLDTQLVIFDFSAAACLKVDELIGAAQHTVLPESWAAWPERAAVRLLHQHRRYRVPVTRRSEKDKRTEQAALNPLGSVHIASRVCTVGWLPISTIPESRVVSCMVWMSVPGRLCDVNVCSSGVTATNLPRGIKSVDQRGKQGIALILRVFTIADSRFAVFRDVYMWLMNFMSRRCSDGLVCMSVSASSQAIESTHYCQAFS